MGSVDPVGAVLIDVLTVVCVLGLAASGCTGNKMVKIHSERISQAILINGTKIFISIN